MIGEELIIGGIHASALAKQFGTPLYVMDEQAIRAQCRAFREAFIAEGVSYEVSYASKALCIQAMCRLVAQEQLSLDVVSAGELHTALTAGMPAARIHVHGNNKSAEEWDMAIAAGVGYIVIDHFDEIEQVQQRARARDQVVAVMLRFTPGVQADTHDFIATGQDDSKFGFQQRGGIALEAARRICRSSHLRLIGVHVHLGSQLFDVTPYTEAATRVAGFAQTLRDDLGVTITHVNMGGGFGIRYTASDQPRAISTYVQHIVSAVRSAMTAVDLPMPTIGIEPGRSIVGAAGTTLYTIGAIKRIPGIRTYVAVDGGMTDNPRPALYGAKYEVTVVAMGRDGRDDPIERVTIAGKCCESGDMLLWDVDVPQVRVGDVLAVHCTGAYNYAMASNYNRYARPAMVFVREGEASVVVRRETLADVIRLDEIPPWLDVPEAMKGSMG